MDAFTYHNIFDTKGIEYLVVIGFFALLIPFWLILNRKVKAGEKLARIPGILTASVLRIPQGLFYSRNHTWTHLSKKGIAEVGLDDLLVRLTGEVKLNIHPEPGEKVSKGDLVAEIERDGHKLRIFSPVSGVISEINEKLSSGSSAIISDPYGKGWIYRLKPTDWKNEAGTCLLADAATTWMGNELTRFRDFLMESASRLSPATSAVILQDGGELRDSTLAEMPDEVWSDFQEDFMSLEQKCSRGGLCE